jgi:hypothetical protein
LSRLRRRHAVGRLPLLALAGAVAVVMALEASLLTGLFGP